MKKNIFTLLLIISTFMFLTACNKKEHTKTDKFDDVTINMSYQTLSSIKMLEMTEETSAVKKLSRVMSESDVAEKEVIDKYLNMMEELLHDTGGFKTVVKKSDKTDYEHLIEITTRNLGNDNIVYSLYYNEKEVKEFQEIDDDEIETTTIKQIEGVAITNDKEYTLEGLITQKNENDETETESKFKIIENDNNYVLVSEEVEQEMNEYEHEYKYIVVNNGKKINEVELEIENENNETSIEVREISKDRKLSYKFKKIEEKGSKFFKIEVKNGTEITKIKVRAILDVNTNTYKYEYKYIKE